jgi:integrase/recombinase XerD
VGAGMAKVNLTKRVEVAGKGLRFSPALYAKNGRVRSDYVLVEGREEYHPEGRYYLDWHENGRRVRHAAGNDALSAENKRQTQETILAAKAKGVQVIEQKQQKDDDRLLLNAVNAYLDDVKLTKKRKTHLAYKTALDYFLESCGKQHLDDLDRRDLLKYSAFLRDSRKLSARSVSNKFGYVMCFLKAQGIRGLLRKHDWPEYVEEDVEIYEKEELEKFFAACDSDEKVYFEFFLNTGMREQEAMHRTGRTSTLAVTWCA